MLQDVTALICQIYWYELSEKKSLNALINTYVCINVPTGMYRQNSVSKVQNVLFLRVQKVPVMLACCSNFHPCPLMKIFLGPEQKRF